MSTNISLFKQLTAKQMDKEYPLKPTMEAFCKIWERLKNKTEDIKTLINSGSSFERWSQREALLACKNNSIQNFMIEVPLPNNHNHRKHCDFYIGELEQQKGKNVGKNDGIWIEQKQFWTWHYTMNKNIKDIISWDLQKHKHHHNFFMFIEIVLQPHADGKNYKEELFQILENCLSQDIKKDQWIITPENDGSLGYTILLFEKQNNR